MVKEGNVNVKVEIKYVGEPPLTIVLSRES